MKKLMLRFAGLAALTWGGIVAAHAADADAGLTQALADIEHRFDELSFATADKSARRSGFDDLVAAAERVAAAHPGSAEALTWQGIVLSTYAGEVSKLSAMKYANAAREALHQAESLDEQALGGGVFTSLGALYSRVPGGFMGFGDDDLASDYLHKALEISPNDLDASFFYAELLVESREYDTAREVLSHALTAPPVVDRPLFDAARRSQMSAMLAALDRDRR